jgi:hypothetical protein
MLGLWAFFWEQGTEIEGLLVSTPGGPKIELLGDTECGVVITHADGTSHYFPGYFSGVASMPASSVGQSSAVPYDSGGVGAVSLIPFDPTNPQTPRSIAFSLQHGDRIQNIGSLPQVGVYTSSTISNAMVSGFSITIP